MSIDTLVEELEGNHGLDASTEALLPHVDSPEFFDGFIRAVCPTATIGKYKRKIYEKEGSLLGAIRAKREFARDYINSLYPTLDEFKGDTALAKALGITRIQTDGKSKGRATTTAEDIISKCVIEDLVDPIMPSNYDIRRAHRSWYVNPSAVGIDNAFWNFGVYIKNRIGNLDDLKGNNIVSTVNAAINTLREDLRAEYPFLEENDFYNSSNVRLAAKACLEFGFIDPVIPIGHEIHYGKGNPSLYIQPAVVGKDRAKDNLSIFFSENFQSLDDIYSGNSRTRSLSWGIRSLIDTFGDDYPFLKELEKSTWGNYKAVTKASIELGFISAEIPDDYKPEGRAGDGLSHYFDPTIVGDEMSTSNLEKYIKQEYETLDSLSKQSTTVGLASSLGVTYSVPNIASECVNRGILSAELPQGHEISRGPGKFSLFVDPSIVGRDQAEENLKRYIQSKYSHVDEVGKEKYLISAFERIGHTLKSKSSRFQLRAKIAELGWLDSDDFRPYAESAIPASYRQPRTTNGTPEAKPETEKSHTTTFVKGEAAEQLMGTLFAYMSPDELVIPQYCLDVTEDYFGVRADFKVGNVVYENKWGLAPENIRATYNKHTALIDEGLEYQVVCLENGGDIGVPYVLFDDLLDQAEEVRTEFNLLADHLRDLAETNGEESVTALTNFRDFFYNVVNNANSLQGEARREYISSVLTDVVDSLYDTEFLEDFMRDGVGIDYSPLEAHFEVDNTLYRGFIQPGALQEEREAVLPDNYEERQRNFEDLARRMEAIPEGSASWFEAPAVLVGRNGDLPIIDVRDGTHQYELSTSPVNEKQIKAWVAQGRLKQISDRYYDAPGAVPI